MMKNVNLLGRVRGDVVVLEVDEMSVRDLMREVPVSVLLVGNIFRDQLDRVGSIENVISRLEECVVEYSGKLVLCGDDVGVARLSLKTKAEVVYFGIGRVEGSLDKCDESPDGKICPRCGELLRYEFYQYSHLGRFLCVECRFGDFKVEYLIDKINLDIGSFIVRGVEFKILNKTTYGVYNALGVVAVCSEMGVDVRVVKDVLVEFEIGNGRMEVFELKNGKKLVVNVVKNVAGANEIIKWIMSQSGKKEVFIVLNNAIADGEDIGWIEDVKFEILADENIERVICGGMKVEDISIRIRKAGVEDSKILVVRNIKEGVEKLCDKNSDKFIMVSYTGVKSVRDELRKL